jgi:hypothetical protein
MTRAAIGSDDVEMATHRPSRQQNVFLGTL